MNAYTTHFESSPCGPLLVVVADDGALLHIEFLKQRAPAEVIDKLERSLHASIEESSERTGRAREQLAEYFEGERKDFDFELRPAGTDFQKQVWDELCKIPFGGLTTYGEVARTIGRPNSSRAVGRAVGTNPIPVVIPCHRVIGKDRSLTGFGGGIPAKIALLGIEGLEVESGRVRGESAG